MRQVYFDYNPTTPLDREVLSAMLPYFAEEFGNASPIHSFGSAPARIETCDYTGRGPSPPQLMAEAAAEAAPRTSCEPSHRRRERRFTTPRGEAYSDRRSPISASKAGEVRQ
jgi:hypothetical protein